jgi:hypothetical protein
MAGIHRTTSMLAWVVLICRGCGTEPSAGPGARTPGADAANTPSGP